MNMMEGKDDAISRRAAIDELIAMREHIESRMSVVGTTAYEMAIEALREPEIIRCKDCAKHEHCRTSTVWAIPPKNDWYCADAERRTNG